MLWPERTDNWRSGAKPARRCSPPWRRPSRRASRDHRRVRRTVSECAGAAVVQGAPGRDHSNDAWIRDCGPTFVIDAKGRRRGIDWTFMPGRSRRGAVFSLGSGRRSRAKGARDRRLGSIPHPVRPRGRRDSRRWAGHLSHDEECLLIRIAIRAGTRGHRGEAVRLSRRAHGIWLGAGVIRTRPEATSMSWPASRAPATSRSPGPTTARIPI